MPKNKKRIGWPKRSVSSVLNSKSLDIIEVVNIKYIDVYTCNSVLYE